jgi:outer membrane protein assembly factor BamA
MPDSCLCFDVSKIIATFDLMKVAKVLKRKIVLSLAFSLAVFANIRASDICISEIRISGNRTTKEFTILRELPFRAGDVMPEDKLIERLRDATDHLNNTTLFNYVDIDYIPDSLDVSECISCIVTIKVTEKWYYIPQVSLKLEDRNLSSWLHEQDFNRITIGWGLRVYNVFGLKHKMTVSHYFGFEKGLRLGYSNIALDRKSTQLFGFSAVALYNKTVNMRSVNNKVIYVKNPDKFLDNTLEGTVNYSYRPGIRTTHTFDLGYRRTILDESVLADNPDYWGTDETTNHTYKLAYNFDYEHRDYIVYPTKGYYIGSRLTGLTADRMRFFYGEVNAKLQYYTELWPRWLWSSRLNAGMTFKNRHAYIYDQHVGYEEKNITGYDFYVVDGQHYAILNNDFRFLLMPKKIFNLGSSESSEKFKKIHLTLYLKLTGDLAYVHNCYFDPGNTLANTLLWGSGIGIDLVTYYEIVLNCSYAVNRKREGAFFFGIKAPIF